MDYALVVRCASALVFVTVVSACAPEPVEPTVAQSRERLITLSPTIGGANDGGRLGAVVLACPVNLIAATEPTSGFVFIKPSAFIAAATARRRSVTCIGDQVFSVGDAGVERVTSSGVSFPSGQPGDVIAAFGNKLVVANRNFVVELDATTFLESSVQSLSLGSAPSAVAASTSRRYVGFSGQVLVLGRDGGTVTLLSPLPSFGSVLVTGDFSPDPGLELAVAGQGGVTVVHEDGSPLWDVPQRSGTPEVPSLAVGRGWLTAGAAQLDALLVGYKSAESVKLMLGSQEVDEFVPSMPGGSFGASVATSGGLVFVGAPLSPNGGAVFQGTLPNPPWSSAIIQNCTMIDCAPNATCFGGVACITRATGSDAGSDAGNTSGDGGIAPGDGGTVSSDGGIVSSDGGIVSSDGGTVSSDGGTVSSDGGTVSSDAGTPDAGPAKTDAGTSSTDGGAKQDAGTPDAGMAPWVASGCTCSNANGLFFALTAAWLTRRRRAR